MTRWGILATGGIAARFAADLRHVPDAELVAVGSRSMDAARSFADRFGVPRAHGSWAALAADDQVDVVYVATPHAAHDVAALACIEAGRAVLVEKPLTLDRASAAALVDAADAAGVFLMEAMWTRCNPVIRRLVDLVRDGAIGEPVAVQADFGIVGPFPPEHRLRAAALGGGAILDLGIYPVTMAHLVLGAPDRIRAWGHLGPEGTDESTGMVFGYASGAVATLTCTIMGETPVNATITGTAGRIEVPGFFSTDRFTLVRPGAEPELFAAPHDGDGYQFEAIEVQRCLAEGRRESPLVPHATTLEVMSILDEVRAQVGVVYPELR